MKLHWKIAAIVLCLAAICGAALWFLGHKRANEQELAAQAKALRVLAEQGNAQAQYRLGFLYRHGQGVPQDNGEAFHWYRKAADQGNAAAEYGVGYMYSKGLSVPQDYTEADRWRRKAAEQGYAMPWQRLFQRTWGVKGRLSGCVLVPESSRTRLCECRIRPWLYVFLRQRSRARQK